MSNQHTTISRFRKLRSRLPDALLAVAVMIAACGIGTAHAAITFTASVTKANGELATTLTWNAPGASSCVGAGHPSWNGTKAVSGTQALPPITMSGTYALTLTCSTPGDTTAKVTWTPPTQNTDGSALGNLAGYRLLWGDGASALTHVIEITNPSLTSWTVEDLLPGPKFFGVKAYNSLGVESALSNVASKTITAPSSQQESVALTVNPVPKPVVIEVE